jgi:demethylspheroidene O-methyltransferase
MYARARPTQPLQPTGSPGASPGWRERLRARWDRVLADPGFQRWASGFFLTRPIARRRASQLFDLCAGFIHSQVLLACLRLRLLERLEAGPCVPAELATALDVPPASLARLLEATTALGLTDARGAGRVGLGPVGAALLGNAAVRSMVEHHAALYDDLRDPVALLRGQGPRQLAGLWAYAGSEQAAALPRPAVDRYSALMAATQPLVAEDLLDAWPFARHRLLLDVGGGSGGFLLAAARRAPALRLQLFDLPAVAALAAERFAAEGIADRASVHGGDFTRDPLPRGADLLTFVRVLHDHDDAAVRTLLRAARQALVPGGVLLVAEPMAGVPGSLPATEAYFAMYLLAMGQGRARTPAELAGFLREAGFRDPRLLPTPRPWQCAVVCARAA